jgi:2',3'-cyclic-nucleotide 3'-phosphodiesterase
VRFSYPAVGVWLILLLVSSDERVDEDVRRLVERKLAEKDVMAEESPSSGWTGGTVWLVPTYKDIAEWQPIARRSLR